MTFGLLSYLGGRVPITGSLNISVPSAPEQANSFMTVSSPGGTVTTSGNYKIIAYYGSGTFNVQSTGIDTVYGDTVEIMMVGGGGGGGRDMGGGGGAGGYYACTSFHVFRTEYTITVGSGGAGALWDGVNPNDYRGANRSGSNGTSSIISSPFGTWEVLGGGGGGSRHDSTTNYAGSLGSGGGSSATRGNQGNALRGTLFGYNGGPTGGSPSYYSGGGGGAGSRGMHGAETAIPNGPGITNQNAPNGGVGVLNSILGPGYYWAGGGGGGGYTGPGGNGGVGGGGGGGQAYHAQNYGLGGTGGINNGANGTQASPVGSVTTGSGYSGGNGGQYTGGGGGGTSHLTTNASGAPSTVSGAGGSGIVVIKYKFQ